MLELWTYMAGMEAMDILGKFRDNLRHIAWMSQMRL